MPKFSSSEDIYRELVENSEEDWLYGLVAFATVEEQRIEWMQHYRDNNDSSEPSADQIQAWYEQQPESILLRAKGDAEGALASYSAAAVDQALREESEETRRSTIVQEIRMLKPRFWPQFGVNVAGGLASAILFAALLIVVAVIVLSDISPITILMGGQSN